MDDTTDITTINRIPQKDLASIFKDVSYFDLMALCNHNYLREGICDNETFWENYFHLRYRNLELSSKVGISWEQKVKIMCCMNMGPIIFYDINRIMNDNVINLIYTGAKEYMDEIYMDVKYSSIGILLLTDKGNIYFGPFYKLETIRYGSNTEIKTNLSYKRFIENSKSKNILSDKLTFDEFNLYKIDIEENIIKIDVIEFVNSELKCVHLFLDNKGILYCRQYLYLYDELISIENIIRYDNERINNFIVHNKRVYLFTDQNVYLLEIDLSNIEDDSFPIETELLENDIPLNTSNIWPRGISGFLYLVDNDLFYATYQNSKYIKDRIRIASFNFENDTDKVWIVDSLLYLYENNTVFKFLIYDTSDNKVGISLSAEYVGTRILTINSQRQYPYYLIYSLNSEWIPDSHNAQVQKYLPYLRRFQLNNILFYPHIIYDLENMLCISYSS